MSTGEVVTIIVGVTEVLIFIGLVVYAIRGTGKKEQTKDDASIDLREKYTECCQDVASIRSEMKINAKATDTALVLLTEKMTAIALTYGQKIAWLEAKVNGMKEHG